MRTVSREGVGLGQYVLPAHLHNKQTLRSICYHTSSPASSSSIPQAPLLDRCLDMAVLHRRMTFSHNVLGSHSGPLHVS
jgi:hypothetical protein